jgi:hypothetical protein
MREVARHKELPLYLSVLLTLQSMRTHKCGQNRMLCICGHEPLCKRPCPAQSSKARQGQGWPVRSSR